MLGGGGASALLLMLLSESGLSGSSLTEVGGFSLRSGHCINKTKQSNKGNEKNVSDSNVSIKERGK